MAKIENTTVYPTVIPAMDDLLIATDVSDNNETVTFLVSDLIGGAGVLQGLQSVLDTGNTATQTIDLTGDINLLGGPGVGFLETCQIKLGGGYGTVGQVITSQGPGSCATWETPAATTCCSLDDTLTIGNTSSQDIVLTSALYEVNGVGGAVYVEAASKLLVAGQADFTGLVKMFGNILDFDATAQISDGAGATGTAGQWLTSQGPGLGVEWSSTIPSTSCCTLQDTIAAGNTSANQSITMSGTGMWIFGASNDITSDGSNIWRGMNRFDGLGTGAADAGIKIFGTLYDGATVGAAGQVLTSTGAAVQWAAASGGSQNLQQVLDIGNTASGVNASITLTGANATIDPTTITDGSGSVGAAGNVLSSTGTGLAWISNACCNLDDTLAVGATSASSITLTGTANIISPFMEPGLIYDSLGATGAAGQVLTVDAGATGVEWATAAAGAVTSVTAAAAATSTGTVTTITPTTGAVVVTPNAFDGSSNVGHVPDSSASSQTTTFLRADGTWVVPTTAATTFEQVIRIDFGAEGVNYTANHYMIYLPFTGSVGSADPEKSHQNAEYSIGTAGPAVGITTAGQHMNATIIGNPDTGSCGGPGLITLCDATITLVSSRSSGTIRVNLWKTDLCTTGSYDAAFECDLTLAADAISCCTNPTIVTSGHETLEKDKGYIITWKLLDTGDADLDVQGTMWLRIQHHA